MFRTKGRIALALSVAVGAIFVAAGGPATAGKLVTKNQVAPSAITTKALADGAVTADKLSKSLRKSLKGTSGANGAPGASGTNGANGASGAKGDTGARGPAGAFNVVDASGKVLGQYTGYGSSPQITFFTSDGVFFTYDSLYPSPNYPLNTPSGQVYFKAAGCTGQGYATLAGYPFQAPIIMSSGTPAAGDKVYVMTPAPTPESFTYLSYRTGSGCTSSSSSTSNAYPVREAGVVPSVLKPLTIVPST